MVNILGFKIGNADEIKLGLNKRTDTGPLIGCYEGSTYG